MTLTDIANAAALAAEHATLSAVLNPPAPGAVAPIVSVIVMANGKTQHTFDPPTSRAFLTERLEKLTTMLSGMGVTI